MSSDTKHFLFKDLWKTSNQIIGLALLQTIGFSFACSRDDFGKIINTFPIKLAIAIHLGIITIILCYAVSWCGKHCLLLLEKEVLYEHENSENEEISTIIKKSTWARIIFILWLMIPMLLSLYAKQLRGLPFNG